MCIDQCLSCSITMYFNCSSNDETINNYICLIRGPNLYSITVIMHGEYLHMDFNYGLIKLQHRLMKSKNTVLPKSIFLRRGICNMVELEEQSQ